MAKIPTPSTDLIWIFRICQQLQKYQRCCAMLFCAVLCYYVQADIAGAKNSMAWAKIAAATVHLYTLYGDHTAPAPSAGAAAGAAAGAGPGARLLSASLPLMLRGLLLQWPTPAVVWDLAAAAAAAGWCSNGYATWCASGIGGVGGAGGNNGHAAISADGAGRGGGGDVGGAAGEGRALEATLDLLLGALPAKLAVQAVLPATAPAGAVAGAGPAPMVGRGTSDVSCFFTHSCQQVTPKTCLLFHLLSHPKSH